MSDRSVLEEALTGWADERMDRGRIADAMSIVLVDYEVMLAQVKDRREYRKWVAESIGDLGDALMAAWDDQHGNPDANPQP